jgi:hypothetical protein
MSESSGSIELNTWLDCVILLAACAVCIVQVIWLILHNKVTVDTADRIVMFRFLYPYLGESLLDALGRQSSAILRQTQDGKGCRQTCHQKNKSQEGIHFKSQSNQVVVSKQNPFQCG